MFTWFMLKKYLKWKIKSALKYSGFILTRQYVQQTICNFFI